MKELSGLVILSVLLLAMPVSAAAQSMIPKWDALGPAPLGQNISSPPRRPIF